VLESIRRPPPQLIRLSVIFSFIFPGAVTVGEDIWKVSAVLEEGLADVTGS